MSRWVPFNTETDHECIHGVSVLVPCKRCETLTRIRNYEDELLHKRPNKSDGMEDV